MTREYEVWAIIYHKWLYQFVLFADKGRWINPDILIRYCIQDGVQAFEPEEERLISRLVTQHLYVLSCLLAHKDRLAGYCEKHNTLFYEHRLAWFVTAVWLTPASNRPHSRTLR